MIFQEIVALRGSSGQPDRENFFGPAMANVLASIIDIGKAVRANRFYGSKLGWNRYVNEINDLLLPLSGLTNVSLGEEDFARAVNKWQRQQGFPAKDSDGIIGPNTWRSMKVALGISTSSGTTSPPSSPAPTTSVSEALRLMKEISAFHNIPWRLGYTIMVHEGGLKYLKHHDGVMQTTAGARKSTIPTIPLSLMRWLLDLPSTDTQTSFTLARLIEQKFKQNLKIQIGVGVQELLNNLRALNGYVALAYQAYNVGRGWSYWTITLGASKNKPKNISATDYETACRKAAAALHVGHQQVRVSDGTWQCDKNMPGWFRHYAVFDKTSNRQLIGYKYLRSFVGKYYKNKPAIACNLSTHGSEHRQKGTGPLVTETSRDGALDKLYSPAKMSKDYFDAVKNEISALLDDGLPLKVNSSGKLVKVLANGSEIAV